MKKCGIVAVLGETNAGKSTLINQLVGQKVSIVSRKMQTTLFRILGVAIHKDSQIVLMDTPGFTGKTSAENLEREAWNAFRDADFVLFVVDVNKKHLEKSLKLVSKIDQSKKVSLVLNKIDLIHKPLLLGIIDKFTKERNFENIFMISALTSDGIDTLKEYLASAMPEQEWMFDEDVVTDLSFETFTAEITREHLYHRVHQEIPYKCKVITKSYTDKPDGSVIISQEIVAKNAAHKIVLLGHKGEKIKAIGEAARKELSELLGRTVHLLLHVTVEKKKH